MTKVRSLYCVCKKNLTISVGVAGSTSFSPPNFRIHILKPSHVFLVQENELWRDSVKLLTETFLGCCFGNPFFPVFGHGKLIIFLCLGREEFVWEDERDEILKDSRVLMEFFPFSRTQYFRTEVFFGTYMMNHCSILRSEFRRGNRVPTSFNLCRLLLMLGFQSPAAPWKSMAAHLNVEASTIAQAKKQVSGDQNLGYLHLFAVYRSLY